MFRVTPYSAVPRKSDRNYSDVFDLFDDFFAGTLTAVIDAKWM